MNLSLKGAKKRVELGFLGLNNRCQNWRVRNERSPFAGFVMCSIILKGGVYEIINDKDVP